MVAFYIHRYGQRCGRRQWSVVRADGHLLPIAQITWHCRWHSLWSSIGCWERRRGQKSMRGGRGGSFVVVAVCGVVVVVGDGGECVCRRINCLGKNTHQSNTSGGGPGGGVVGAHCSECIGVFGHDALDQFVERVWSKFRRFVRLWWWWWLLVVVVVVVVV